MEINIEELQALAWSVISEYGLKLLAAIFIFIIGRWIINLLSKGFNKVLEMRHVDATLSPFLKGLFKNILLVLLIVSVLGTLGIEMTSFIAILGAAGLAVGMALSGTLQNFAGSVMILLFKPYKVGDYIDAQGHSGTVKEIQIFNTILTTPDNKTIIIPNGGMANGSMTNFSTQTTRRVDWTFGIGYGDNADQAMDILKKLADEDDRILKDPEVFIALSALADSSVNFVVRAWVDPADYWDVYFDMNKKVYSAFDKEGLNIPYPQMDVHLHKVN